MADYIVTRKSDGAEVLRYSAAQAQEVNGFDLVDYDHTEWNPSVLVSYPRRFGGRRLLTKLEFRSLFQESTIKAIDRFEAQFEQSSFLTDEQKDTIRTGFNDYHAAENVNLDDPRWVPGLGLYVSLGIMTAEEVTEVLNG